MPPRILAGSNRLAATPIVALLNAASSPSTPALRMGRIAPTVLPFSLGLAARSIHYLAKPKGRWDLVDDGRALQRTFKFKNFSQAWDFITAVSVQAKIHKHHPEWSNVYNRVFVRWTTHDPPSLSPKDMRLARVTHDLARQIGEIKEEKEPPRAQSLRPRSDEGKTQEMVDEDLLGLEGRERARKNEPVAGEEEVLAADSDAAGGVDVDRVVQGGEGYEPLVREAGHLRGGDGMGRKAPNAGAEATGGTTESVLGAGIETGTAAGGPESESPTEAAAEVAEMMQEQAVPETPQSSSAAIPEGQAAVGERVIVEREVLATSEEYTVEPSSTAPEPSGDVTTLEQESKREVTQVEKEESKRPL